MPPLLRRKAVRKVAQTPPPKKRVRLVGPKTEAELKACIEKAKEGGGGDDDDVSPIVEAVIDLKQANAEAAAVREAKFAYEKQVADNKRNGYPQLGSGPMYDGLIDCTRTGLHQQVVRMTSVVALFNHDTSRAFECMRFLRESGLGASTIAQNQAVRYQKDNPRLIRDLAENLTALANELDANVKFVKDSGVTEYAKSAEEVKAEVEEKARAEEAPKTLTVFVKCAFPDSDADRDIVCKFDPKTSLRDFVEFVLEQNERPVIIDEETNVSFRHKFELAYAQHELDTATVGDLWRDLANPFDDDVEFDPTTASFRIRFQ